MPDHFFRVKAKGKSAQERAKDFYLGDFELKASNQATTKEFIWLSLSELGQGCACSMLSDDTDFQAHTWKLKANIIDKMSTAAQAIMKQVPSGFAFRAVWAGESIQFKGKVSLSDFRQLINDNHLKRNSEYEVVPL